MPFKIVRNDITRMNVDAVVNTANELPTYGEGLDTAIYKEAGKEKLLEARRKIGELREGDACITSGFQLPAKYIIHAVSPFFFDGNSGEEKKLRACYRNSLHLAKEYHCQSIAFPLISTGSYGYPKEEGMRIAVDEINAFLLKNDMHIYLVVFDSVATKLGQNIYPDLEQYIDTNYVHQKRKEEYTHRYFREAEADYDVLFEEDLDTKCFDNEAAGKHQTSVLAKPFDYDVFQAEKNATLEERMEHLSDTFTQYLFYLIGEKKLTNAEVYKRAIITKQTFSKIKCNTEYHPDKLTAMRLCIGAQLNLDETKELLARAGYALSPCDKRDVIFSYFIERNIFDMIEIDIALEEHGLPCFIE